MRPGSFTFQEFLEHDGAAAGVQTDRCLHPHQLEHADSRGRITHWQRHSYMNGLIYHTALRIAKLATSQNYSLAVASLCHSLYAFEPQLMQCRHTQHSIPADSSDGVVTRLWTGRCKFRCQARVGNFVFPKTATPRRGTTQHSIQRRQKLFPSSPSSEEANKEWRCTSTPRYKDKFTFGFIHLAINL